MHTRNLNSAIWSFPWITIIIWCPKENATKCSRTLQKSQMVVLSEKCILLPSQELIQTKNSQSYRNPTQSLEMMVTARHQIIPSVNLSPEYVIINMWRIFLNIL